MLFPLHLLIVLSNLCLSKAKSGIGVLSKNNAAKNWGNDLGSMGADADRGSKANNPGTRIDIDIKTNNPGTRANNPNTTVDNSGITANNPSIVANYLSRAADNPGTAANNSSIASDNPGTIADNLGKVADNQNTAINNPDTEIDADAGANILGTAPDNSGIKIDANVEAHNPSTVASNKACTISFFALRYTFFLLVFSSKLVTASLSCFLPSSSSTTLWSKPILLYLVTSMKQKTPSSKYSINKISRSSLNKISLGISAVMRLI